MARNTKMLVFVDQKILKVELPLLKTSFFKLYWHFDQIYNLTKLRNPW